MPLDPHITDNLGEDFLKPGYIYCPLCTHLKKITKKMIPTSTPGGEL